MILRVAEQGKPAFQLRKGEEGISVFDSNAVQPTLTETEVLNQFRPGSCVVSRSLVEIEDRGLRVIPIEGAEPLSERLKDAHGEIRPGTAMTRAQFKAALKELE